MSLERNAFHQSWSREIGEWRPLRRKEMGHWKEQNNNYENQSKVLQRERRRNVRENIREKA